MKNKIIVWVVVGVVVAAGIVWFVVSRSPAPAVGLDNTQNSAPTANGTPMSMAALLSAGTSQKCTFNSSNPDGSTTGGTIYVTAGHMRGDFTSQSSVAAGNKTTESHMITDGTTSYVWTDASQDGFKMSFASMEQEQSSTGTAAAPTQSQSVDPSKPMNYNCSGWSPDQSEFALPTNITFSDMSALMEGAAGAAAGANVGASAGASAGSHAAMCAECSAITNASGQAQCKAAMGCN